MISRLQRLLELFSPTLYLRSTVTVRYAFSLVLLVAMAVGTATVLGSRDSSRIFLVAPNKPVVEGSIFSVDIMAYAHTPVNVVSLVIDFPEDTIEVLGIDKGESVITLWTKEPEVLGNKVHIEGGTYRRGFIGEHKIATLNVRALDAGAVEFITTAAQLVSGDGQGTEVVARHDESRRVVVLDSSNMNESGVLDSIITLAVVTDIDNDGKVTFTDVETFMKGWVSKQVVYDFNNDGKTTFRDFSIILAHYFGQ